MICGLEDLMYQMSDLFLAPVLFLLIAMFAYSLFALGAFAHQAWQRRSNRANYLSIINNAESSLMTEQQIDNSQRKDTRGYPLISLAQSKPLLSRDELDVAALENMETVRTVSRLAPMLGLIATMVPMGPALKSLADGDIQGISDSLIIAFSAVIFGLVISSITFWIASIKKRWLATELVAISPQLLANAKNAASKEPVREAA
ncbi:MAG: MotA/TolQ/ExbB proton channel family protein [Spongiibacteraceae bacterium]|nr:MotA/TolQ/ExbB proton channel family protein [Spongiibacteraceae bacterium]